MFLLVNSVIQTLVTLLLFSKIIIIIHAQDENDDLNNDDESGLFNTNDFFNTLNGWWPGQTFQYEDISNMITDSKAYDDQYEFQFRSDVNNFLGDKLIIGQLASINQIVSVTLSFHEQNGDIIRDYLGNPIRYTSTRQELGHVLDILHQGFSFSYARCLLQLQTNTNFDYHSLFFHFTHPSSSSNTNTTVSSNTTTTTITITTTTTTNANTSQVYINGSTSFSAESLTQTYNTSAECPADLLCMWLLDDEVIASTSNTTVRLTFEPSHIGNRTLKYVVYRNRTAETLASLLISISSDRRHICSDFDRQIRNRWVLAGNMSSPRAHFTVTYLLLNQYILIVGGTANFTSALSTYEVYDPRTGCYNVSDMIYRRMYHTASYYNNSDVVLLIGGIEEEGTLVELAEFISLTGTESYLRLPGPRARHEVAYLNDSNIYVVGGIGTSGQAAFNVVYERNASRPSFQLKQSLYPEVNNFEGHAATTLGDTGMVLVSGGYYSDDHVYSNQFFLFDGTNSTPAFSQNFSVSSVAGRAHHQATYIPNLNAVLITGGHDDSQTYSSCYLYSLATQTVDATSSMIIQRAYHADVLLSNGSVLIIGGVSSVTAGQPSNPMTSVERFDSTTKNFTSIAPLNVARYAHKAVYLPQTNEVFVFGGIDAFGNILSSFEYIKLDPPTASGPTRRP